MKYRKESERDHRSWPGLVYYGRFMSEMIADAHNADFRYERTRRKS